MSIGDFEKVVEKIENIICKFCGGANYALSTIDGSCTQGSVFACGKCRDIAKAIYKAGYRVPPKLKLKSFEKAVANLEQKKKELDLAIAEMLSQAVIEEGKDEDRN